MATVILLALFFINVDDSLAAVDPFMLKNIYSSGSSSPVSLTAIGDVVYFSATDGTNGIELWKSDGTATGTVMVKNIKPAGDGNPTSLVNVNGTLYFSATDGTNGYELWKSDGTAAGTVMIKDIRSGSSGSSPSKLTNVNGTIYFSATDGTSGIELWKSDGTAAGTVMVKDIRSGGDSTPDYLTNVNGTLYFTATNGTSGIELWKSDGTAAGTVMVKDIYPGSSAANPYLLVSAGTSGLVYFVATEGVNGYELWKSDGTTDGTTIVKDIYVGGNSSPDALVYLDGSVYFSAETGLGASGRELWRSNGTATGTMLVKNIDGSNGSSNPLYLTKSNGFIYFSAADTAGGYNRELWKSDGTASGTVMVKDIKVGSGGSYPINLADADNNLYFSATDGTNGIELWRSDGTASGTVMVKDIKVGGGDSNPSYLTSFNGNLCFSANDGTNGAEPWMYYTDIVPPVIAGLENDNQPGRNKTWEWSSNDPTAVYRYVIDQDPSTVPSGEYGNTTTATQIGGDGTYYIHVQARDNFNNESQVIHAAAVLDNTAPSIIGLTDDATPRRLKNWSWSSNDLDASFRYVIDQLPDTEPDGSYTANWSAEQASGNGNYYLHIQARDSSGNESAVQHIVALLDNIAPTIATSSLSLITSTRATIAWVSDESSSSAIDYGQTATYSASTAEADIAGVTNHEITITDLIPCTSYHYRVKSKDLAGNEVFGSNHILTTSGCTAAADIIASSTAEIAPVGGELNLQNSSSTGLILAVPANFATSSVSFQANQLDAPVVLAAISTPLGFNSAGNYIYELRALSGVSTTVASFNAPLGISITYGDNDISGLDAATLAIHRWDGTAWNDLSNCSVNAGTKTVTCETRQFSTFGLFGQQIVATQNGGSGAPLEWSWKPAAPADGFKVLINNGSTIVSSRLVNLGFNAGSDVAKMAISLTGDFAGINLESYQPNKRIDLCPNQIICRDGEYNVFVKFYTKHGVSSATISQPMILSSDKVSTATATTKPSNLNGQNKSFKFNKNLKLGSISGDVRELQRFLNAKGYSVAKVGAGSAGHETTKFGLATRAALIRFQKAKRIFPASGNLGPITRQLINGIP